MKYWIETYGCQMNKAESNALELELNIMGWEAAESPESATLAIINTCSVRKTAEDRIWGRIGFFKRIKKDNPHQKLIITGCMAERLGNELTGTKSPVDKVFGTFEKNQIVDYLLEREISVEYADNEYIFKNLHSGKSAFKSFIPIMNGCNNFCSYCIVPYVRGREISRNPDEIFNEIVKLEEIKIKEITLLGQNVNSYYFQNNSKVTDFPDLLESISKKVESIEWIRFLTSHPKDLSDKLIEVLSNHRNICRHIHLPLQSGSDKILGLMNRKYNSSYYYNLVEKLKKSIPGISITTDIIVGFPGEDENDFINTYSMMENIKFEDAFTYYYNARKGTKADSYEDNIPKEIKLERLSQIIRLQKQISHDTRKKKIGNTVKVLSEGLSKNNGNELIGRTEYDEMIVFPGNHDKIGMMQNVKITSLKGNTFKGEIK